MEEYTRKKEEMEKIVKADLKKGKFTAIEGDVDKRGSEKLDVPLH